MTWFLLWKSLAVLGCFHGALSLSTQYLHQKRQWELENSPMNASQALENTIRALGGLEALNSVTGMTLESDQYVFDL